MTISKRARKGNALGFRFCYKTGDVNNNRGMATTVMHNVLKDIRELLAALYKHGNEDVRLAIINGALEHLFEDEEIKKEFADWKNDKELNSAYLKAAEWSVK